jgi:hypothetical protein
MVTSGMFPFDLGISIAGVKKTTAEIRAAIHRAYLPYEKPHDYMNLTELTPLQHEWKPADSGRMLDRTAALRHVLFVLDKADQEAEKGDRSYALVLVAWACGALAVSGFASDEVFVDIPQSA